MTLRASPGGASFLAPRTRSLPIQPAAAQPLTYDYPAHHIRHRHTRPRRRPQRLAPRPGERPRPEPIRPSPRQRRLRRIRRRYAPPRQPAADPAARRRQSARRQIRIAGIRMSPPRHPPSRLLRRTRPRRRLRAPLHHAARHSPNRLRIPKLRRRPQHPKPAPIPQRRNAWHTTRLPAANASAARRRISPRQSPSDPA